MRDAVKLIEANLAEEKKTDKDLTVLAESIINDMAEPQSQAA